MSNSGVSGKIVNTAGVVVPGLLVEVLDKNGLFGDELLGHTLTTNEGRFDVSYTPGKYGLEANPDLQVKIYSPYRRLICQTEIKEDYSNPVLVLGTITIPSEDIEGWKSTCRTEIELTLDSADLKLQSKPFPMVTSGNILEPVIDNVEAWKKLTEEVRNAKISINMTQFYFDVGAVYTEFPVDLGPFLKPFDELPEEYIKLEKELLNRQERGVDVRILVRDAHLTYRDLPTSLKSLWDNNAELAFALGGLGVVALPIIIIALPAYLMSGGGLPYPIDTASVVAKIFDQKIAVRQFRCGLTSPLHAKFAVFDRSKGFFCTSPLTQDYYDSPNHLIDEPRRGNNAHQSLGLTTLLASGGTANLPVHDVSLRLEGPVVGDMDKFFFQLWSDSDPVEPVHDGNQYPRAIESSSVTDVQLVRTITSDRLTRLQTGEKGILEAYLRAIEKAKEYIYIEDQYYTEPAINEALISRLKINQNLRIIILINFSPDTPGYLKRQQNLIGKLLVSQEQERVRVFTLWTFDAKRVIANYIHSKVAIIDDFWVTLGSANLDEAGMQNSIEINAVMGGAIGGGSENHIAAKLRQQLWKEHLGLTSENDPALNAQGAAMFKLWDDRESMFIKQLKGEQSAPPGPFPRILKYRHHFKKKAKGYLNDVGIANPKLEILDKVHKFSFEKGTWI
jgi:phosphatidylserine/phosphatidylglycerophosphate/cardiolipin synthase-like enzyme